MTVPRCFSIPILSYLSDPIKEFLFKCIFRKKILDIGKTFHTTLIRKGEKIKGTQREQSTTFNDKCCSEEDNFHHFGCV